MIAIQSCDVPSPPPTISDKPTPIDTGGTEAPTAFTVVRPSRTPTPTPALPPESVRLAAAEDVTKRAIELVEVSRCPLRHIESNFATVVTEEAREQIIDDIVESTATVMAEDFQCETILTLQEARDQNLLTTQDLQAYRNLVDEFVQVGDLVVPVDWIRITDGVQLFTRALVDDSTLELVYEPIISSWRNPGTPPDKIQRPVPGSTTWQWRPWGVKGATVTTMIFGLRTVWKKPVMVLTFDDSGRVVTQDEDPQVSTFLDTAKTSKKTEVIAGASGDCKRWSFRIHWATPTGKIKIGPKTKGFDFSVEFEGIGSHGTDLEVYELCSDGTVRIFEGPG